MKLGKTAKPTGVLTKAFRIIDLIRTSVSPLALQEISYLTKINKSTALRLLAHLEMEQYLCRNMRGGYSVGPKLLQPWAQASAHARLRDAARRHLWELWQSTKESVNLGVLDGYEVLYLDCLESPHSFRLVAQIGARASFYRTSLGKAVVAFLRFEERGLMLKSTRYEAFTPNTITSATQLERELEEVRQLGYAVDNEESRMGVRCVAAPVLDAVNEPLAAVSVSGPASRITPDSVAELGAAVRVTAQEISVELLS